MGLSTEERYDRVFHDFRAWRAKLAALALKLDETKRKVEPESVLASEVVRGWVRQLDELTGMLVEQLNSSNSYWVFGENSDSFLSLCSQPENIPVRPPSPFDMEPEAESLCWWAYNADYSFTAWRMAFHPYKTVEGVAELGAWWDAYRHISSVLYAVNRYRDNAFPDVFRERLLRFFGEFVNRRFDVCFGGKDTDEASKAEAFLLAKHKVFHLKLDEKVKATPRGDSYTKEKFDGYALYAEVAAMDAKQVRDCLEAAAREEWSRQSRHAEEREKEKADKPPPVFGLYGPPLKPEDTPEVHAKPKKKRR